jgi:hypothetical protein
VAPGSVQLYSEVVVHARSRAACKNNIPHKNRGVPVCNSIYKKKLIFSKKKFSGNKLIKEGHVRKIILEPCERKNEFHILRGGLSATPLLTKNYFLMEGVFWE